MYESFRVRHFRCFQDLKVAPLARVNLITGLNNVGKTALLEALFVHSGRHNASLVPRIDGFRGLEWERVKPLSPGGPWDHLFFDFDLSLTIELESRTSGEAWDATRLRVLRDPADLRRVVRSARLDSSEAPSGLSSVELVRVLELAHEDNAGQQGTWYLVAATEGVRLTPVPPPLRFSSMFLPARVRADPREEADRYTRLVKRGQEAVLLEILKVIEPRLTELRLLGEEGKPLLQGRVGLSSPIQICLMGEGMVRLASVVLAMSAAANAVLLVDEIENGLHHSVMTRVWSALGEAARRFDTQVFATTHSRECIIAAHDAFAVSNPDELTVHRLERAGDSIRAVTFDLGMLKAALEMRWEVR